MESARKILDKRLQGQLEKEPKGKKWHEEAFANDLKHFQTDRIYDYGPPRLKLFYDLAGNPS